MIRALSASNKVIGAVPDAAHSKKNPPFLPLVHCFSVVKEVDSSSQPQQYGVKYRCHQLH